MSSADRPVVAGVDGSRSAGHAVRWAAREAARQRTGLRVVHVAGQPFSRRCGNALVPDQQRAEFRQRARRVRDEAAMSARAAAPEVPVETVLAPGALPVPGGRAAPGSRGAARRGRHLGLGPGSGRAHATSSGRNRHRLDWRTRRLIDQG
ncbi:universal stress protein [Goodfellowiella coeruleoviolacea]|uniref:Universal stress protein family protein n=1 Tax=Goodfellowiella coeruleoviolacea TaxID=334858 RepID=A0AAE3KMQ1_9PSEU|nr:universal stress protein [Goodfellowiella coeruleoviolacea]MCP2167873.1 Universal stress protein family protein [Goodfellowiella coeruleoviolacea]